MAEYKKQHVLAQSYLKGFSKIDYYRDPKNDCPVWFYDISEKILKFKAPKNIAYKPYYYSPELEDGNYDHFLEKQFGKIENIMLSVIKKLDQNIMLIRSNKRPVDLTYEDKLLLIHNIFWHIKKVPSMIDTIQQATEKALSEISEKFNYMFSQSDIKNKTLRTMISLGTDPEFDFIKALLSKNFGIFYLNNDSTSFITTDKPVCSCNKHDPSMNGLGIESTEVYFPLNKRILIGLYGKGEKYGYMKSIHRREVYKLNRFIASESKYFIVSRDKEYLIKILDDLKLPIKENK